MFLSSIPLRVGSATRVGAATTRHVFSSTSTFGAKSKSSTLSFTKSNVGWRRAYSSSSSSDSKKKWSFIDTYMSLLNSHPLLTKAVTSGIITAAGDIGCQTLVEKKEKFDFKRFFMFSGLGLVLVGPTLHVWYGALNKFIPAQTTAGALYRLALDQTVFAGPFIATFMSSLLVLEGRSEEIQDTLSNGWWSAVKSNWLLWIPANFINFRFVVPRFQVLFANAVAVLWNTYLSWATH